MVSGQEGMKKSNKIRVGVNVRMLEFQASGIQNFTYCLFNEILKQNKLFNSKDKFEFIFFSTGKEKVSKNVTHIIAKSNLLDKLHQIDERLSNVFFDNFYILKLLKEQKINIFISPSFILPVIKPKGMRFITVIHDLSFLTYKSNIFKIYTSLVVYMKTVMPFILKKADKVLVPSFFTKRQLIKVYKADLKKIKVIYEGRDDYFYQVKSRNKFFQVKKKYKITSKYIFTNATNQERKNIYGLVKAFRYIKEYDNYQLLISGLLPKDHIEKIKNFISQNKVEKRVKFLGYVSKDELRTLYSFAKIFIYPSFEEGFGLPIIESTVCGCLPVASNTGSIPEVLGCKQLLFNPRDIKDMTAKINEVIDFSSKKYNHYLSKVEAHIKRFSWKKAAIQYLEEIKRLC